MLQETLFNAEFITQELLETQSPKMPPLTAHTLESLAVEFASELLDLDLDLEPLKDQTAQESLLEFWFWFSL